MKLLYYQMSKADSNTKSQFSKLELSSELGVPEALECRY